MSACCELTESLEAMRDKNLGDNIYHKEEMKARIAKDEVDRSMLRKKLESSIDVFDHSHHPKEGLVNVTSGKVITDPKVNVHDSLNEGKRLMQMFESKLPDGFYEPIPRTVKTMDNSKKGIKAGDKKIIDPEVIYARALAMRWIDPDFKFEKMLEYELAPHPTSMFDEEGVLRTCKQKSKLINALKVQTPARLATNNADAIFLDGCAIFWKISWPTKGTVIDFINNFKSYLGERLKSADVHLVFDRYYDHSIKGLTRKNRDKGASRVYKLSPSTPLPSRDIILTVTDYKVQLIRLIIENVLENPEWFHSKNKLVVTGPDPIPFEINNGVVASRPDLKTTQEEADTILIHQVSLMGPGKAVVVADDTDVFVLLLHFVFTGDIEAAVIMESTSTDVNVIDINATAEKHSDIMPNLLAAHAISGCDTVASTFGIGKPTVVKALRSGDISLSSIGDLNAPFKKVVEEGTALFLRCHGQPKLKTMTEARIRCWKNRVSVKNIAPKLESLPATDVAFWENLKRGHLQAAVWISSLMESPPDVDFSLYGWEIDTSSSCLQPTFGPPDLVLVPDTLLKIMRCGCKSGESCKGKGCSCSKAGLPCTTFCDCEGGISCHNPCKQVGSKENDGEVPY